MPRRRLQHPGGRRPRERGGSFHRFNRRSTLPRKAGSAAAPIRRRADTAHPCRSQGGGRPPLTGVLYALRIYGAGGFLSWRTDRLRCCVSRHSGHKGAARRRFFVTITLAAAGCDSTPRRPRWIRHHDRVQSTLHTPNVKRLPVFQSTSCSGISVRIFAMKFRPVQCIGITTSGASAFSSAIVYST